MNSHIFHFHSSQAESNRIEWVIVSAIPMIPKSKISVIHLLIYLYICNRFFLFSFQFHSHAINMSLVIWAWEGKSGKIKRSVYSLIIWWFCFSTAFMHAWKMGKYKTIDEITVENSFKCDELEEKTHPYPNALTICWATLRKKIMSKPWKMFHSWCILYTLLLSKSFNSSFFSLFVFFIEF